MSASPTTPLRTERGLERLIFFTDAVVAIAITLIALPLVDSAREVADGSAAKFLRDNDYALVAAAISFAVISAFWRDHHRLFERATGYTPLLIRVNMLWLLTIVTLPMVTELEVYARHHDRLAIGLYVGVVIIAMALHRITEIVLYRAGLLADGGRTDGVHLAARWVQVSLAVIALVVAVSFPQIGMWSMLIIFATGPLRRLVLWRFAPRPTDGETD